MTLELLTDELARSGITVSAVTEAYLTANEARIRHDERPITPNTYLTYTLRGRAKDYAGRYAAKMSRDLRLLCERDIAIRVTSAGGSIAYVPVIREGENK